MIQRLGFAALALLAGAGVGAQEPQRPGGPGGFMPPGFALFAALNTEPGESLSAAEIDNAPAILMKLDANGDGKVTAEEFPRPAPRGGGPGRGRGGGVGEQPPAAPPTPEDLAAMLMAFDSDKDGKLKKGEVPERIQGVFERADEDKDGVLTPDEIKKAAAAQPQPTAAGRGGPGGPGGPGRGGPPRGDPLLAALDRDGDGALSADEIAASPGSLRRLDANGDGLLTMEEVFAGGRGRG